MSRDDHKNPLPSNGFHHKSQGEVSHLKNVNFLRHPINGKDCDYGNNFLTEKLEKNITVFSSISWKNRCLNIELRNDFVGSSIVKGY